jgi:uncharacterized membrane protein YbhN (UPF0104 family)
VDAFAASALELWFNSDDHLPPHFHAENAGKWEVRVFFMRAPSEMFKVVWTTMRGRPKKSDLKALGQIAELHRLDLLEEWHAKVNVRAPGPER